MKSDTDEDNLQKFISLPFRIIETNKGILLKRGRVELKVDGGQRAIDIIQKILEALDKGGANKKEIYKLFSLNDRQDVSYIINELLKKRFIVPLSEDKVKNNAIETELDIFYWHFEQKTGDIINKLKEKNTIIIGVNHISRQISSLLSKSGMEIYDLIDYPPFRSILTSEFNTLSKFPIDFEPWQKSFNSKQIDCIIATSDIGGMNLMRKWNRFCIEHDFTFIPIILQDLLGYIGPIVVPHETACFECFLSRLNANRDRQEFFIDNENMVVDNKPIIGYHPAMASILADIAVMELIKFYAGWFNMSKVGRLIKVNLLTTLLTTSKVLKIPRCNVCSPLNRRPTVKVTNKPYITKSPYLQE